MLYHEMALQLGKVLVEVQHIRPPALSRLGTTTVARFGIDAFFPFTFSSSLWLKPCLCGGEEGHEPRLPPQQLD